MALIGKREDLIHVPWSSVEEWLQVYKQIYSGNLIEQKKAYDTLLVWKARIPKLPVGVECTLGLIQVCLRDREWMPKINSIEMSASYENDLQMMYSTVIMKFLNHISNIAHNKHTSLFIIAKQLNIPDWIVDLRHDIAHGHELPSIDVMRIVANILLTWLHEEYWAAEAKTLHESQEMEDLEFLDSKDEENLIDLIELWTAVGLYIKTKHVLISDLPDTEIRDTLNNIFSKLNVTFTDGQNMKPFSVDNKSELSTISNLLLLEISKNLSRGDSLLRREKIVIDCILHNEAFLTNSEILSIFVEEESNENKNCLPQSLIDFWKDFLLLLQDKKILLSLFLQLIEVIKIEKDNNKKLLASLWIKSIAQAFRKQKIARREYQCLEQKFDHENKKLSIKSFPKIVLKKVEKKYPDLKNVLSLNVNGEFPNCLLDDTFVKRLILNFTEYSEHVIPEILNISSFLNSNSNAKSKLLDLINIISCSEKQEGMEVKQIQETEVEKSKETQNQKTKEKEIEKSKETQNQKTKEKEIEKTKEIHSVNIEEIEDEKTERMENKKTERIEDEKTERMEDEKTEEMENEKTERMENEKTERMEDEKNERMEQEKTERMENEKTEEMEQEKTERMEDEKTEEMEQGKTEKMENEKTERMEDEKTERMENEKTEEMEQEKTERMENEKTEEMEQEKTERMENEKTEEMEQEKTERMENEKTEEMEQEKTERMENEKTERMEDEKNERMEDEKNERMEDEKNEKMEDENTKEIEVKNTNEIQSEKSEEMEIDITEEIEVEKSKEVEIEDIQIEKSKKTDEIFTVQNLKAIKNAKKNVSKKTKVDKNFADLKIRNTNWTIASEDCDWSSCPIGILPWQIDDVESLEPTMISPSDVNYAVVKNTELPKIINSTKLKLHSKIQWENLLKKNKKIKRKVKPNDSSIINETVENSELNVS